MTGKRKTPLGAIALCAILAIFVAARTTQLLVRSHRSATSRTAAARSIPAAGPPLAPQSNPAPAPPSDPWSSAQTVQPAALAKEITDPDIAKRPVVVCVAPHVLYAGGHIPGALFHGPGMNAQGLDDLKKWAQDVPRSANIVLYCGCCPLDRCPNLRPAFSALQAMGFTRLRALLIPTNLYTDWVTPGFPIEKSN